MRQAGSVHQIRRQLDLTELRTVKFAREAGISWSEIAPILETTREVVWQRGGTSWTKVDAPRSRTHPGGWEKASSPRETKSPVIYCFAVAWASSATTTTLKSRSTSPSVAQVIRSNVPGLLCCIDATRQASSLATVKAPVIAYLRSPVWVCTDNELSSSDVNTTAELAELFAAARSTIHRVPERNPATPAETPALTAVV